MTRRTACLAAALGCTVLTGCNLLTSPGTFQSDGFVGSWTADLAIFGERPTLALSGDGSGSAKIFVPTDMGKAIGIAYKVSWSQGAAGDASITVTLTCIDVLCTKVTQFPKELTKPCVSVDANHMSCKFPAEGMPDLDVPFTRSG